MPGNVDNKLIYHLGVLIPFWVLELLAELVVIAGGAIGLSAWIYAANNPSCTFDAYGDYICYQYTDSDLSLGYGAYGSALGLGILFLLMHITQIALFGRRKLTPAANFGFELPRLIIFLAAFILQIVAFQYGDTSILAFAFVVVVWCLYLGSTIYSIVIFHRSRRGAYNGSSTFGAASASYAAPSGYTGRETEQTNAHPQQHYGPGPYQAPGAQEHFGPGPYQQTQYQQASQYSQSGQQSGYTTSHGVISPVASPQPAAGHSVYSPPPQQTMPSSEKQVTGPGY